MPKYDVMIEYRAQTTGISVKLLEKGLDVVTHRMQHFSAVMSLHGDMLALDAEVEASDPYAAVSSMDARLRMEMKRVELKALVGETASFWITDQTRQKAQLLRIEDKGA